MKRVTRVIILAFLMTVPDGVFAQTLPTWGLKFGINRSIVTGGAASATRKSLIGQSIGLYWRFDVADHIYVQPEFLYAYKRAQIERPKVDEWDVSRFFHDLSVPLLVGYEFSEHRKMLISIFGGIAPIYRIKSGKDFTGDYRGDSHTSKADFSIIFGSGVRLPFRKSFITLDGRVDFGRAAVFIYNNDESYNTPGFHLHTISLLLGLPI